jgi:2-polyprenyl-3-methyl-5-hydroxy-6-metoxy-1,4-benzoquinol methylase
MPLETLKNCPVCDHTSFNNYLNVEDHTVSHREFTIQQCNTCNLLFTNPRPDTDSIGQYYESKEYISHHDEGTSLMSRVYTSVRDYTIGQKVKLINSFPSTNRTILDIGCGTGNFIQACKKDGWSISATEPDMEARNAASKKVGDTLFESIFREELNGKTFDVITMWHVLEHVHLLSETITWLAEHLNPNGKIIIAVPNPQSYDAQQYGKYWAAYDVPRHLYHFTRDVMKTLLAKQNLAVENIKPMWFDSFYVSMLSTKYQAGHIKLLQSLGTGLKSNLKGKTADHEALNTSSLIYIISHK